MVDITRFRKLISTKGKTSVGAKILFSALLFISLFYRTAVAIRNFFYDVSIRKAHKAEAVVISVGNITTGGTGKTPLVAWICNYLAEKNVPVAILTRGYKMTNSDFADEPAMLAKAAANAKVIINPDRVAGAKKAVEQLGIKTIVMDDGFQHRRLHRNVDIVAIDATEPFGYGKVLPAGLLREPLKAMKRATAVVITRYNQSQPENIEQIQNVLEKFAPKIPVAKAMHKPVKMKMTGNKEISFAELADKKIFAFCAIGNPEAFFQTLTELSLNIVGTKVYNDHHRYSQADINDIYEQAKYCRAEVIVTTQKDWTKTTLLSIEKFDAPFAYLVVELEFIEGKEKIIGLIEKTIEQQL